MSSSSSRLLPGDSVFHPRHGFGTVNCLTRRDPARPIDDPARSTATLSHVEDYYEVRLMEGGTLLVPVSRAESVGLRRLTVGIEAAKCCLRSPAQTLPANFRERAAILRDRERLAEPQALAHSVRDVLARSRGRALSAGEKTWLDKSCLRISTEAALVDHISVIEARATIFEIVRQLSAH